MQILQHLPDFKGIETHVSTWKRYHGVLAAPPWLQRDWDCITTGWPFSITLAAPPWLQRDWDRCGLCWKQILPLQHLPDFKGIETQGISWCAQTFSCSTSLTSKGLRRYNLGQCLIFDLQHLPDFKGIETLQASRWLCSLLLQHLPDFKGIETHQHQRCRLYRACSTSLTSKGLRLTKLLPAIWYWLAAPPWLQRDWDLFTDFKFNFFDLQHLPDFKGIETQYAYLVLLQTPCSTSLTSKGLRPWESIACARSLLAAPPWLQRDWDPIQ